jgi:peptidyl-prolyl cis-trans isomerase SurA
MLRIAQSVFLFTAMTIALQDTNATTQQSKRKYNSDRIVAVVHQQVITAGDWDEQERIEALVDERVITEHEHRKETLERLVKRTLIVQQMSNLDFKRATAQEIEERLVELKKSFPSAGTDVGWNSILRGYSVEEPSLRNYLAEQLDMLRFIDIKFRAGVRILQRDVLAYYNEVLSVQLKEKNATVPPFADVRDKITAILTEKRVNELLEDWLNELQVEGVVQWKVDRTSENQ